jgi:hypothetical protein
MKPRDGGDEMMRRRRWIFVRNTGIAAAVVVAAGTVALIYTGRPGATSAGTRSAVTAVAPTPSVVRQAAPATADPTAADPAGPATTPDPGTVTPAARPGQAPGSLAPGSLVPGAAEPVPPPGTRAGFGLVEPGTTAATVAFAAARRSQSGGPETLRAVHVARYRQVRLAPGARLWITVPIYQGQLPDVVRGVQVAAARFATSYRAENARFGPIRDRAHMFDVRFDSRGRIAWIHQYFTP